MTLLRRPTAWSLLLVVLLLTAHHVAAEDCQNDSDCGVINCFKAPCPTAYCRMDGTCGIAGLPESPKDECTQSDDCGVVNCFAAPCDFYECIDGLCELQPAAEDQTIIATESGEKCGRVVCAEDEVCCNPTCSTCTAPGGICTEQDCGHLQPDNNVATESVTCGPATCATGQICCNKSCGICTEPGGFCTMQYCFGEEEPNDNDEVGPMCGPTQCQTGEECCNSSCGICVPKGASGCTQQFCEPDDLPLQEMECQNDSDCPEIACFAPPCDPLVCSPYGSCVANQTVACGLVVCAPGMQCCDECGGRCTHPNVNCTAMSMVSCAGDYNFTNSSDYWVAAGKASLDGDEVLDADKQQVLVDEDSDEAVPRSGALGRQYGYMFVTSVVIVVAGLSSFV